MLNFNIWYVGRPTIVFLVIYDSVFFLFWASWWNVFFSSFYLSKKWIYILMNIFFLGVFCEIYATKVGWRFFFIDTITQPVRLYCIHCFFFFICHIVSRIVVICFKYHEMTKKFYITKTVNISCQFLFFFSFFIPKISFFFIPQISIFPHNAI